MVPDLVLADAAGGQVLVDVKYKPLAVAEAHGGISQPDLYQMYAYGRAGLREYDDIVLLYPRTVPLSRDFRHDGLRVYVRQIDLRAVYDAGTGRPRKEALLAEFSSALSFAGAGVPEARV